MALRAVLNLASDRVFALPIAVVYLTDRCNSRCITCDYWRTGEQQMSLELAARLATGFREAGVGTVLLSGGEPLIHPHWEQIADGFRAGGARLQVVTNGLSGRKHAAALAERVGQVFVSLDGASDETYAAIRGVDGLGAVCEGVRALRGRGVPVTFRCTLQRANAAEVPALVSLARRLDARISFLAVDTANHRAFARAEDWRRDMAMSAADVDALASGVEAVPRYALAAVDGGREALRRLVAFFRAVEAGTAPPPVRCNAPRVSAVFEPDGRIRPCFFLPVGGAVDDGPVLSALNAPELRAMRRQQRAGERPECVTCVCTLRRGVRSLLGAA